LIRVIVNEVLGIEQAPGEPQAWPGRL